MKILVAFLLLMAITTNCSAEIQTDKALHFGAGYIINDQLKRHTKLTFWERMAVILTISYLKEKRDTNVDKRDMGAAMLGAVVREVKF